MTLLPPVSPLLPAPAAPQPRPALHRAPGADAATPDPARPDPARPDPALRRVARDFEAAFLAEMLGHAGLARPREGPGGGGIGEGQMASFLAGALARDLAERGGIGLAESIHAALQARHDRG